MKRKPKSIDGLEAKVRRDKRFRHGLYSKAVKNYWKLNQEFRDCGQPTAKMIKELMGAALIAGKTVEAATNNDDPDSVERYLNFITTSFEKTHRMVVKEVVQNFQIVGTN